MSREESDQNPGRYLMTEAERLEFLPASAESHGREPVDECGWQVPFEALREGGLKLLAGFRSREARLPRGHGRKAVELHIAVLAGET